MTRAFIGVGSNITPERNIREALRRLAQYVRMTAVSTFYRQPAIGRPNQADFVNGVVAIDTGLSPSRLEVDVLHRIETRLGRRRTADKYASRSIDLDLLLFDGGVGQGIAPPAPHPDILNRAFVAIPLSELAPSLVLPSSGIGIRDVAARFSGEKMKPLHEYTRQLRDQLLDGGESAAE